ncbi:hypothetical protein [Gemmata sp.]|uniref:hypothetical protein n=1 Tax=Gemmata sp. TaxID=1914242 RepID=UPI003F6F83B4
MRTRVLTLAALVLLAPVLSADDHGDRGRRARAAVAAAKAMAPTAAAADAPGVAAVAPAPRPVVPKGYALGRKESLLDNAPLVVYVTCDGPKVEGAVTCFVPAPTFGDVTGPAVVVGYPAGDRMIIEKRLPKDAPHEAVKRAVENAAKKIEGPAAKQMPPAPLDLQIRKGGCGDGCACTAGDCPAKCPVASPVAAAPAVPPTPVIVGYTLTKVCNGNGTCRLVRTPIYR